MRVNSFAGIIEFTTRTAIQLFLSATFTFLLISGSIGVLIEIVCKKHGRYLYYDRKLKVAL
jgi:hypothetical protein